MKSQVLLCLVFTFLVFFPFDGNTQTSADSATLMRVFHQADSLLESSKITEGKKMLTDILPDLKSNKLWEGYFSAINDLSQLETEYGNIEEALKINDVGQEAIKAYNLEDTDYAYSLSVWRVNTLIKNNEYKKALDRLKFLLNVCRTKTTTVDSMSLHNQFSLVYSRQGKYTLALEHSLNTLTHDSLLTAVNCFNVATFYDVLNDGDKRDEYLLKAYELAQEKEGIRGIFEQINVLLFMANLAKDESNIGLASEYANQAENLFLSLPEENKALYGDLNTILQRVQITIAMKQEQEQEVRKRMAVINQYMTPNACFAFNELANYFGRKMNTLAQDSFLERSLLCVQHNNNNPVLLEFYQDSKMNSLFQEEKYTECIDIALKAYEIADLTDFNNKLKSKSLNKVRNLNNLYKLSTYLYHAYSSEHDTIYLNAALATSDIVDSLATTNIKDVTSKLSRYKYDQYFMLAHHIYAAKYNNSGNIDDLNEAIRQFERIRTYQQAKIYTGMLLKENVDLKRAYKSEQQTIEELNELEKSLVASHDSIKHVIIDEISDTREKLLDIRKGIKADFPIYYTSRYQTEFPTLDMVQAQMRDDQKIVTYSKIWNQVVIMELSKQDHHVQFVEVPLLFLSKQDSFISNIKSQTDLTAFNQWMSSFFIDPLDLEGYTDITFITDPKMPAMPFEMLITDFINPQPGAQPKNIRYAYSLTSWLSKADLKNNDYLVALTSSYQSGINMENLGAFNVSRDSMLPIPNTEKEVDAIASLFRNNEIVHNPSKAAIKKALQSAGIIHFATHAVINNENPNFSKLDFDTHDDDAEENDVFLYEIPGLDLQAQLVCLSSCNSGVGRYISGEGVSGLGQTFAYAGCTNTVQSLWPVDDASTAVMMELFYTNLKAGQSKPLALSNAKRQFVQHAPDVWKHPYFWAGFVYYGDNEPLHTRRSKAYLWWILGSVLLLGGGLYFLKNRWR